MKTLFVQIKQIGKRKPVIEKESLEIPESIATLRALLEHIVCERIATFNEKNEEGDWTRYLTGFDLATTAESGKVGFDTRYNVKKQDVGKAVEAALLAFEDGLFRVFLDDNELESLGDTVDFPKNCLLTFVRLTMLSGRSW
jgi:hypothetical protein